MKLGVRAHDYGKMEIEALAARLHEEGCQAAQLAIPKAITGIDDYTDITHEHLLRIRQAFAQNNVDIPVLGCYMDLGNPDPQVRRQGVDNLKRCLYFAKEIGAGIVGTETAYPRLNAQQKEQWRPYMMDSIHQVVEEAQRLDAKLAVEPVYWHPLDSLDITLELARQINDPEHLRFILDPSNLLEFPANTDQDALWSTWLDAIGQWVDVIHVKDFTVGAQGQYQPTQLGKGVLHYDAVCRWLQKQKREIYLLREEIDPATAAQDLTFLKHMGSSVWS